MKKKCVLCSGVLVCARARVMCDILCFVHVVYVRTERELDSDREKEQFIAVTAVALSGSSYSRVERAKHADGITAVDITESNTSVVCPTMSVFLSWQ